MPRQHAFKLKAAEVFGLVDPSKLKAAAAAGVAAAKGEAGGGAEVDDLEALEGGDAEEATAVEEAAAEKDGGAADDSLAPDDASACVRPSDIRIREFSTQVPLATVSSRSSFASNPSPTTHAIPSHTQYKMFQKPYEKSKELSTLAALKFYESKVSGLEVREPGTEWEEWDPNAMVLKVVVYNEDTDKFNDPVAVNVARDGTVDKMRTIVSKLMDVPEAELQLLRLLHGAQQPRADIFSDGSKRLQRDLNLYEGQCVYAERLLEDAEEGAPSRAFNAYYSSMNQFTIKYTPVGGKTADLKMTVDKRWTVAKLRDELALELGLDTPEQKANFRIRKQIMQGTEVKVGVAGGWCRFASTTPPL